MSIVEVLFEKVTGKPYWTGRQASSEYGLPPAALYRRELAGYSDAELMQRDRNEILAEVRRFDRAPALRG